jgi:hypothetical protein
VRCLDADAEHWFEEKFNRNASYAEMMAPGRRAHHVAMALQDAALLPEFGADAEAG